MTDVLTDVLRNLRLRIGLLGRGDFCGNWALDFGEFDKAVFHLIGRGPFWLHCDAFPQPVELNQGDVVFLPQPRWHQFSGTPARHAATVLGDPANADGPTRVLVCCTVEFEPNAFDPVLNALPPVMIGHCQDEFASAELAALVRLVLTEYDATTPGYEAMRERLAEALLIQLLRYYIRAGDELQGLLRALAEPALARALSALHGAPGHAWDVGRLAAQAGMSRSAFARRFGGCMGTSPMQYLSAWRMHLAHRMLRERRQSVAQIAEALGYHTEAAFRHAFKRVWGVGPGEVRRAARPGSDAGREAAPSEPSPVPPAQA